MDKAYIDFERLYRIKKEKGYFVVLDDSAVGYRLVLTKADKIKASELEAVVTATQAEARKHSAAFPVLHVTSSEKGMGIAELRAAVLEDALIG